MTKKIKKFLTDLIFLAYMFFYNKNNSIKIYKVDLQKV